MSEERSTELVCMVRFSVDALAQILELPEGAYIDAVESRADIPGELMLRLRGVGYPLEPGRVIAPLSPVVTRSFAEDGRELRQRVTWPTGSLA